MHSAVQHGDCLEVVRNMASESMNLVYVDPPFFTQKTHSLVTRDRSTTFEFSDEWKSRAEYNEFLGTRLKEFRRVLKVSGSLFFHCDANASHHIRFLLDEVFGESMFHSEIVWQYRRWSNSQRNPMPSHQTIFFYSKTDDYQYRQLFDGYSPSTNIDQILQRRQRDEHGKSVYARDEQGNVVQDGHKKGVPVGDVWDIPLLNPKAKERVGYPTQKPILLLERIIELVTAPGDWVLDPFCGSGTTVVAAELLGRNSVGIDIAIDAVNLTRQRLAQPVRTSSELLQKGRDAYIQSDEEALAHLRGLPIVPVQRNRGMDAILNANPGEFPILIRVQRRGESVVEAAESLCIAGRSKQPAILVLIVTDSQQPTGLFNSVSPDVLLVNSTAVELIERLADRGIEKLREAK
ncbi:MAG TPA: site-specific DNA-methyltransferase [Planctomycetota bacterium]|nr:site-specific DNA-methyltransferase [Planctomycetota bacterium]